MSRTLAVLDDADWDATETLTADVTRQRITTDSVYRIINTTDAVLTVTFSVTHNEDDAYEHAIQTESISVAAGTVGGTLLTEPWERLQIGVTPDVSPTAGNVELIGMGGL